MNPNDLNLPDSLSFHQTAKVIREHQVSTEDSWLEEFLLAHGTYERYRTETVLGFLGY